MKKIKEILIGTNNIGKYRELCDLLPEEVKKYSPTEFNILSPKENGKNFEENSIIKASYFSKKTNLICLADDSGLEIDILNKDPGIYSARWAGIEGNFDIAIKKVFSELNKIKKDMKFNNKAKFICCLTLYWPDGKISVKKRGKKGFGYDPIFIPNGYKKTFGEMDPKLKMSIDHRFNAFKKIKNFFI